MTHLYIDTETIPAQRTDVRDRIYDAALEAARTAEPPADILKLKTPELREERIDEWRTGRIESSNADAEHEYRKTSLEGGYCELVAVCFAWGDEPIRNVSRLDGDEPHMLAMLWDEIRHRGLGGIPGGIVYAGHNLPFDLSVLHHRSVILGMRPPYELPYLEPPWRGRYIDTQYMWWGARPGKGSTLTTLCDMLGIDVPDNDIDGSQVWDAYQSGRLNEIVEHCRRDVARVREIVKRLEYRA